MCNWSRQNNSLTGIYRVDSNIIFVEEKFYNQHLAGFWNSNAEFWGNQVQQAEFWNPIASFTANAIDTWHLYCTRSLEKKVVLFNAWIQFSMHIQLVYNSVGFLEHNLRENYDTSCSNRKKTALHCVYLFLFFPW